MKTKALVDIFIEKVEDPNDITPWKIRAKCGSNIDVVLASYVSAKEAHLAFKEINEVELAAKYPSMVKLYKSFTKARLKYTKKNKKKFREYQLEYRKKNKDKVKKYNKTYREKVKRRNNA